MWLQGKAPTSLASPRISRESNPNLSEPKADNFNEWLGHKDVGHAWPGGAVSLWWNTDWVLPDVMAFFLKRPEVLSFGDGGGKTVLVSDDKLKGLAKHLQVTDLQLQTIPSWVTSWHPITGPNQTLQTCSQSFTSPVCRLSKGHWNFSGPQCPHLQNIGE